MPFPTIDPAVNEYTNPITGATYARGPNDVWTQTDQFNTVDIETLKNAFNDTYVNVTGDTMTGQLRLNRLADDSNGFQIRGRKPGSDADVTGDLVFWVKHNTGTTGDAINYHGLSTNDDHIVNKKYVDDAISGVAAPSGFLPLTGGTLTGSLTFSGAGSRVFAGTTTNLSGRCSLLVVPDSTLPLGVASGSSTNKMLALYRYDDTQDDNRFEFAAFHASGYTRLGGKLRITANILTDTETVFEVRNTADEPSAYVKKGGMAKFKPNKDSGPVFEIAPSGLNSSNSKNAFSVWYDGAVRAGHSASEAFIGTEAHHVVTKSLLDTTVGNYLSLSGGTMTGDIAMGGNKVTGVGYATADGHAASKKYVDDKVSESGGSGGFVQIVSSAPSGAQVGDIWLNTTDNCLYIKKS